MFLSMPDMDVRSIVAAFGFVVFSGLITFFIKLYKARMVFVELQKQGMVSNTQARYIDSTSITSQLCN